MPGTAVRALRVGIDWRRTLSLDYAMSGDISAVLIPPPTAPSRTDELWRHTCYELFVTVPQAAWYCEFNFAPSGAWAAYGFDAYRSGMQILECAAPVISLRTTEAQLQLHVELALDSVAQLRGARELQCALTAVVEERAGARTFWALTHATERPDFHHAAGFALQVHAG